MYHPNLGRFIQPDPSGFDAGDTDLYRFVDNNPVNDTDPSGLQKQMPQPAPGKGQPPAAPRSKLTEDSFLETITRSLAQLMVMAEAQKQLLNKCPDIAKGVAGSSDFMPGIQSTPDPMKK